MQVRTHTFYVIPPIFVFSIARYSCTSPKNRKKVIIPDSFTVGELFKNCQATYPPRHANSQYTLTAAIAHFGDYPTSGSYIPFIPTHDQPRKWQPLTDPPPSTEFQDEFIRSNACILVYQRPFTFIATKLATFICQAYSRQRKPDPSPTAGPQPPPTVEHTTSTTTKTPQALLSRHIYYAQQFTFLTDMYLYVKSTLVVDLRQGDFTENKIPDSLHIPFQAFQSRIEHLRLLVDKFRYSTLIFHCRDGYALLSLLFPSLHSFIE